MAVPKRHLSKARRDKRRSNVWKLEAPTLVKCSNCGSFKLPTRPAATAATTRARKSSRRADLHFTWWQHGCMTEGEGIPCLPLLRVTRGCSPVFLHGGGWLCPMDAPDRRCLGACPQAPLRLCPPPGRRGTDICFSERRRQPWP